MPQNTDIPTLILASASPRRRALLAQIGVACEVHPVDIDESVLPGEHAIDYVRRLAVAKARACQDQVPAGSVILGSDTAVVLDDEVLGKPECEAHGLAMLRRLANREHEVLTAVCLLRNDEEAVETSRSRVGFGPISETMLKEYWASGEAADKAGGYGIQGRAAAFIHHVSGSYSGVVGLPLYETAQLLRRFGIPVAGERDHLS